MTHSGHDPDRTELLATRGPLAVPDDAGVLEPGARIGRHRIVELIGRGGMGEVYRAEQLEPVRRTVALKLMRGRRMDARHLAYFEVERQLLAQMRHPAIAQVFDAGTTPEGQPWFAMEFIAGSPLTTYCETHQLPLEARLRLLIGVCEGVQHAHQRGVVHRDLKPGNLLVDEVDGRPLPKIIDFGIATAASGGDTGDAEAREVAGTPDYMSPEQASGDPALVDTRSDVYSLGVVLFELLNGRRPGAGALPAPRGELDWVVARAMAPDRGDRYQSASELAEDLRRFLQGHALSAVPPTPRYRIGKFVRRHRSAVAAATIALVALVGGLAMSVHGLLQARAQRAIAEERSTQLETVAAFQQSMLEQMDMRAMGAELSEGLREQVGRAGPEAAAALDEVLFHASPPDLARRLVDGSLLSGAEEAIASDFAQQPLLDADLTASIAAVRAALGLGVEAARGYAHVAAIRERELGPADPATLDARRAQTAALLVAGDADGARRVIDQALLHASALAGNDPLRLRLEHEDANVLALAGDRAAAREQLEALHLRAAEALGEDSDVATGILNDLAILQSRMGDPAAGLVSMQRLAVIREREHGRDSLRTLGVLHNLGPMLAMTGDAEGAIELQREVVERRIRLFGAEHPDTLAARANLATFLVDAGRSEESLEMSVEVIEALERVRGVASRETLRAKLNRATAFARIEEYERALALQAEVLDARTRLFGPDHPDTLFIGINFAGTLLQAGRTGAALERVTDLLPSAREVLGLRHPQAQAALQIRGEARVELGEHGLASRDFAELLQARREALGDEHHQTIGTAALLADALADSGLAAEAATVRAELVEPLLAKDPDTLAPPLRTLAESLRDPARRG